MKKIILLLSLYMPIGTIANDVILSSDLTIASNYIYRGMTQSNNKISPKISINAFYNNFYTGSTIQSINLKTNDNFEIDYYVGYTNLIHGLTYDINLFVTNYDGSTKSSEEISLGLSWPCQFIDNMTLGATYAKGIDESPDNFNLQADYDLQFAIIDASYNDYKTIGKTSTVGLSKSFNIDTYNIETSLLYSDFKSNNQYIKNQDNVYLVAKINF